MNRFSFVLFKVFLLLGVVATILILILISKMMMNHPKLMVSCCANFGGGGSRKKMQNAVQIASVRPDNIDYSRFNKGYDETKPLSLVCPWVTKTPLSETISKYPTQPTTCKILGPGMVLLENYISLWDQADIVNMCEELGLGPGGFYIPHDQNGEELWLQMMSLGRNWDPVTKYKERCRSDGSEAPPLPSELISLTETALQDAQAHLPDELPSMRPDVCVVNFYSPTYGRLGIHQDCDESPDSLQRGLPVVSISIGDWAEFVYGHETDENKLSSTYLMSGDVLIFGGKSRHIFHGVKQVFPFTTLPPLKQDTALRPGRLNLTLRQF